MKIPPQQIEDAYLIFMAAGKASVLEEFRAAIESISDPLPTLRPIAEMPETVPEGCVRMYVYRHTSGCYGKPSFIIQHSDRFNLAIDILLPVESPEDKMRAEFEAWASQRESWSTPSEKEWAYEAWKAAKSTTHP